MVQHSNHERVAIFIDGSNHYHILKEMFPDKRIASFNFRKFIKSLIGKRKHVRIYYYGAPLDMSYNEQTYI